MRRCNLYAVFFPAIAGIFFNTAASAQAEGTAAKEESTRREPEELPAPTPPQSSFRGSKFVSLVGNYGMYSFLVPGKKGAQLSWIQDASSTWEFDYFSGDYGLQKFGVNLISFGERVMVFRYRQYWSSTFNLGLGLGERRYSFELGHRLLEKIPGDISQREKLIELTRYVFDVSLGNRWHFRKGLVLSADWLDLAIPFGPGRSKTDIVDRIEDEEDKKNTKKVLKYLNYLPTVSVIKLGIGFAF